MRTGDTDELKHKSKRQLKNKSIKRQTNMIYIEV